MAPASGTRSTAGGEEELSLAEQMVQMMKIMADQQAELIALRREASVPVERIIEPKANAPDTFSGKRADKLNQFLFQCEQVFQLQRSQFPNDQVKIRYMIGYLRDSALDAVRPLTMIEEGADELDSLENFVHFLKSNFGDPDELGTVRRNFKSLKQTGNAADYFAKVREYVAVLGWPQNGPVVDKVIDGLSSDLKDEMARSGKEFDTLEQLTRFIIPLDNRLRARDEEKKKETKEKEAKERDKSVSSVTSSFAPKTTGTTFPTFTPRTSFYDSSLSRPQQAAPNSSRFNPTQPFQNSTSGIRPPITEGEREDRRRTGRCMRCGERGHILASCPKQISIPNYPSPMTGTQRGKE